MKQILLPLLFLLTICFSAMESKAQGCSMCTATASQLGEKGAKGLNNGILYLAGIPLTLLGAIGFMWYRHSK